MSQTSNFLWKLASHNSNTYTNTYSFFFRSFVKTWLNDFPAIATCVTIGGDIAEYLRITPVVIRFGHLYSWCVTNFTVTRTVPLSQSPYNLNKRGWFQVEEVSAYRGLRFFWSCPCSTLLRLAFSSVHLLVWKTQSLCPQIYNGFRHQVLFLPSSCCSPGRFSSCFANLASSGVCPVIGQICSAH